MAYGWLLSPVVQIVDRNGTPVVGGKVYVYDADTSILSTIYGDDEGTEISNPVLTDTLGNFTIFADSDKVYDIKVFDQNDMLLFTKLHLMVNIGGGGSGSGNVQAGEGIVIRTAGDISIISVDFTEVAPLSALDGLASEDWVENQGYLTKTSADTLYQPIGNYALESDLLQVSSSLISAQSDIDYISANIPVIPDLSANEWNSNYETVQANSAQWGQGGQGDVNVNNYVYNNSAKIDDTVTAYQTNSGNYLTDSGAFYPMTGNPSGFMDSLFIAVYGQTPFSAVRSAADNNKIVYCKVSPTGATRMAHRKRKSTARRCQRFRAHRN